MGGLGSTIQVLVRLLGIQFPHYGPHVLPHASATNSLAQGFSLKEIGDHLGHRSGAATRVYAKVDMPSLRQVADLEISDLIQHAEQCQRQAAPSLSEGRLAAFREVAKLCLGGLRIVGASRWSQRPLAWAATSPLPMIGCIGSTKAASPRLSRFPIPRGRPPILKAE